MGQKYVSHKTNAKPPFLAEVFIAYYKNLSCMYRASKQVNDTICV